MERSDPENYLYIDHQSQENTPESESESEIDLLRPEALMPRAARG